MTLFLWKKSLYLHSAIDIDSVLKIDNKRSYPQAYLEQCKYKLKKRRVINFINDEIVDDKYEVIDDEISKKVK